MLGHKFYKFYFAAIIEVKLAEVRVILVFAIFY
jgi:hypothetical protein